MAHFLNRHIRTYPTTKNLKYSFSIGFVLSFSISLQILTGLFLSSFYIPCAQLAEHSINYINNEISNGFLIQRTHVIFASIIFILLYTHLARAIYYSMYKWENRITWWSGLLLLYLCIAEAFTGYILPWGQMSFWGATVITNLVSIIPFIGEPLIKFIWGGSIVGSLTLERFFMIHYLLPSLIVGLIILHLTSLHKLGSTNTLKNNKTIDYSFIPLYPYFIIKDLFVFSIIIFLGFYIISFHPDYFDNLVNNLGANSKITPKHIVPEWYFLSFYIILKLITIKWVGILIMFAFMLFPIILPFLNKNHYYYNFNNIILLNYNSNFTIAKKKFRLKSNINFISMYSFANWKNIQMASLKGKYHRVQSNLPFELENNSNRYDWRLNKQTGQNFYINQIAKNRSELLFTSDYTKTLTFIQLINASYFELKFNIKYLYDINKLIVTSKLNTHNLQTAGLLLTKYYKIPPTQTRKKSLLNQHHQLSLKKIYNFITNYKLHYSKRDTFIRVLSNKNYYHSLHWSNTNAIRVQLDKQYKK